ncbi:type II secretion system F family protein [uncultured Corynebacterium sp.]|uniref:type II secretion system F family protein n=1 Tax=uncultured Corynebacterium sp. TaxID=159447 RepID=UPI0025982810|nr:type II secretion system F family protein [uncultured Corynebacterium sp.]
MWLLAASAAAAVGRPNPAGRVSEAQRVRAPGWVPVFAGAALLGVLAVDRAGLVAAAGMAAATAADTVVRRREAALARRRSELTAGFLGHLVTNLRAGASLADATSRAAEHLPASVPAALLRDIQRAVAAVRSGGEPDAVLACSASPELREVGALWGLAATRGLPVAELLARARDRLDAAQRHRAATEAALAGPKTTAIVLSALPAAGVAMGTAMGADPLGILLGGGLGGWLLAGGTALVCAGFLLCERIIAGATA